MCVCTTYIVRVCACVCVRVCAPLWDYVEFFLVVVYTRSMCIRLCFVGVERKTITKHLTKLPIDHCTLYVAQCRVYVVQCRVYVVQCRVHSITYTYIVQCTLYNVYIDYNRFNIYIYNNNMLLDFIKNLFLSKCKWEVAISLCMIPA